MPEIVPETAAERFVAVPPRDREDAPAYNVDHVRTRHLLDDAKRTLADRGVRPGELAPDFALPRGDGGELRLSDLRGAPVLLHCGSLS